MNMPSLSRAVDRGALLVIDVQRELFDKSTPIYRSEQLLSNVGLLVERAQAAGALVAYVQHSSDKVLPWGSDGWQLHPRLHPTEGDLIVHKRHSNAFEETILQAELASRSVRWVVVTGLVTHGCVKATCLGARALGYPVTLAADGHSSYSKDAARLIDEWNRKLGEAGVQVRSAEDIVFA